MSKSKSNKRISDIIEECRKLAVITGKHFIKCLEEKGVLKPVPKEPVFTIPGWPEKERRKKKPPIEILK
jgi:hypothetical protein